MGEMCVLFKEIVRKWEEVKKLWRQFAFLTPVGEVTEA
jgi:hypothetical protein